MKKIIQYEAPEVQIFRMNLEHQVLLTLSEQEREKKNRSYVEDAEEIYGEWD